MLQIDQIREDVLVPDHKTQSAQTVIFQELLHEQAQLRIQKAPETGNTNTRQDDNPSENNRAHDRFLKSDQKVGLCSGCYSASVLKAQSRKSETTRLPGLDRNSEAELSEDEKAMVKELSERDREVRMHEQVHSAMLGRYAGSVRYDYQVGPDGHAYAIGGSTEVRSGHAGTNFENFQEAKTIQRAAMGAGNPSSADISVAIKAEQRAQESTFNSVA